MRIVCFARSVALFGLVLVIAFAVGAGLPAAAQADLPDAPLSQSGDAPVSQSGNAPAAQSGEGSPQQTSRILGIVPNFRAVSSSEHLPPQSVHEKFMTATQDSFDYSSLCFPTIIAAINFERNKTPEFGGGAAGFGRYWWHAALDQTSENYWVEFIVPTVTHEDTRYYTLGHGGFLKRTGYALSRAVVTRSDAGKETFNLSEVAGAAAAAGLSNAYYPNSERTVGNTMSQWALDVGIDAGTFWFKEFWPDLNRRFFHEK